MGVELKNNIKQYWWQSMVLLHENIVGIDSAIFMPVSYTHLDVYKRQATSLCCNKDNAITGLGTVDCS